MTVMRETGLIVVSTKGWSRFLLQLSLQAGWLVDKQIQPPCEDTLSLECVQVAGWEYVAISCIDCRNIKLMNLNKQNPNSGPKIQYEVITAFNGDWVGHMCQGEDNKLFVQSDNDTVLELDRSTTAFTKVRTINTGPTYSLCYVPDGLLVVSHE